MKIVLNKKTLKIASLVALSISFLAYVVIAAEVLQETKTTTGTANVTKQVAIGLSTDLISGIKFPNKDPGTTDNNASYNFNASDQTTMWIVIESSTNTPIDICTKDNAPLTHTDGTTTIPNSGFRWNVSTSNDATNPKLPGIALSTSYDTSNLIANDQSSGTFYLRYWLDIPTGQKAGNYNNTVYYWAEDNTTLCGE
jgi:hypothetical protein